MDILIIRRVQGDEQCISDWSDSKSALQSFIATSQQTQSDVHSYFNNIASAKSTTDFLSSYYSGLQRDTASVLQWAQQDAQGGTSVGI